MIRKSLDASQRLFVEYDTQQNTQAATQLERARRHAHERVAKLLVQIQSIENQHDVKVRWSPDSVEWREAGGLATMQHYQKALDRLEGLVVSRLFELTKMNMSRTGMLSLHLYHMLYLSTRIQASKTHC